MTSSAHALIDVLAAEGGGDSGFQSPTIAEFYPPAVAEFSVLGIDFEITRITIIMWIATAAILTLLVLAARKASVVPNKLQYLGESGYSLVRDGMARDVIGPKGLPFAPFLASLFFFILANNFMSIFPFAQISPNSRFAIPLVLAVIVWVLYNYIGIREQGAGRYFKDAAIPPGVPKAALILVTPIELLQVFIIRPFTLAVRLFANMFAGHMLLVVFSLGAVYLLNVGNFSVVFAPLSFLMALVMTFFELLVILLQAYVFVILTATYLNGAVEPAH
ncbi:MAG TPA: F0F1 ATP synthase subunit A [Nocardioides sp.]|uniref:ATP synthase subunit a n=1 Tax=Geodermatophilus obscurus (strain ATCC 25078 / DSM 43160 / JCM 3152 / CCUG 61914 / KCC A-0152 / KCTC 9177 / NBRC 13315 / NRRL B-3577 / G-20) TaxID=526225 RepID=D2SER9_GEOOG|nr:F0F1 ATP synthase subunit A [Geodermatophilus obscurus]ADB76705.1 ATP synthase F0, A subunit [Geodermatophilus obscurus DSM 43160]HYH34430.1 F0F1 ATP synthase subunit A [Nocardioides sp.]